MAKRKVWYQWLDQRLPFSATWKRHFTHYYLPKNLNFLYVFGSIAIFIISLQVISGVWLSFFYTPTTGEAFNSIEYIMREVPQGWLIRYIHTTGASFIFIVIYLHIFRSLNYGSYKNPRELVWFIGMFLYLVLLAESFLGYLLPWGQLSYWGSQILLSLIESLPIIGKSLRLGLQGNYVLGTETLHRFYILHILIFPTLIAFFTFLHIAAVRSVGSNNPSGKEISLRIKNQVVNKNLLPFYPFYISKDLFALAIFLCIFCSILFFMPTLHGYFIAAENSIPANPLKTPDLIHPQWYFSPYYTVLRIFSNKLLGLLGVNLFLFCLFLLPFLDQNPIRSLRYRGWKSRLLIFMLCITFLYLSYLGMVPLTPSTLWEARIFTSLYFLVFLMMPWLTKNERNKDISSELL